MRYADLDELIADYIPEAKSEKEKTAIERILENVSEYVDVHCQRVAGYFAPSAAEPSVKRVRGEGQPFLRLPVHVFGSITDVKTSYDSVIPPGAYYESEKNGWLYAEDDSLYSLYPEASFDLCSPTIWADGQTFKVTARWGYAETPKPVVEAVRLITARIWSTQRGTIGQLTPEGFIQERLIPTAAKDLLKPFIKREFER
jgi:hypothetical protein